MQIWCFYCQHYFGCAPLAMNNNVVKADAMEKPAQSNNAQGGQQGATGKANGTQGDSTTNPVAKPDSENSAVKVQHAGTKEDAHY